MFRYCFTKVLDEGKRVHMVYQGHLLRPDTAPLSEFTLDTPAILICQISHSVSTSNSTSEHNSANNNNLDLSGNYFRKVVKIVKGSPNKYSVSYSSFILSGNTSLQAISMTEMLRYRRWIEMIQYELMYELKIDKCRR